MENQRRKYTLDAMRGIAAILVVAYHIQQRLSGHATVGGYLAVDFFFALSGLVINDNYKTKLLTSWSLLHFIKVRVIRLYPMFILGAALGVVVALNWPRTGLTALIINSLSAALMLPSPLRATELFPLNIPAWSLFLEMAVNIVFGMFLYKASTKALSILASVAAALIIVGCIRAGSLDIGWDYLTIHYGAARALFAFIVGIFISRLSSPHVAQTGSVSVALVALLAVLIFISPSSFRSTSDLFIAIVLFPIILWLSNKNELPSSLLRPAAFLGDISYPLYAIHFPLMIAFTKYTEDLQLSAATLTAAFTAGTTLLAWIVFRYVDVPSRETIRRLVVSNAFQAPNHSK